MDFTIKPDLSFNNDDILEDFEQSIPLMSEDEVRRIDESGVPEALPILPLKNTVLYPGVVIPITVGRDRSLELVRAAYENDRIIAVVAQKNKDDENPGPDDLHRVRKVAHILKLIKMPDGTKSIVIQGKNVFETISMVQTEPYFMGQVQKYQNVIDLEGV